MQRQPYAHWVTIALATLIVGGCGGSDGGDPGAPNPPTPTPAPVQTNPPRLTASGGNRFDPANVEVPVGTTVTFVWESGFHNVTSAGSPSFQGSGSPVSPPKSFPVTFTQPGTYIFFCSVHGSATSGMRGTIRVR